MQKILVLLVVILFSAVTVHAVTYSCRDKQGKLHMTDNVQNLPRECLGRTDAIPAGDSGTLSIVSGQKNQQQTLEKPGADFQTAVGDATREQQERKKWLEALVPRVENVVLKYQQAVRQIYDTTRSGRLRYRDIMTRAKEQKQEALEEKQQILVEISGSKISRKDRAKITSMLEEVKD